MSYLVVKEIKGVQEGLPIITVIYIHLSTMMVLMSSETGAVWERIYVLSSFMRTHHIVCGQLLEEATAVWHVNAFFPACTGCPYPMSCTALHT
jgi:hypothetical protein